MLLLLTRESREVGGETSSGQQRKSCGHGFASQSGPGRVQVGPKHTSGQLSGRGSRAASQHASGGDSPWQHSSGGLVAIQHSGGNTVSFPVGGPPLAASIACAATGTSAAPEATPTITGAFPPGSLAANLRKAAVPLLANADVRRFRRMFEETRGIPSWMAFQFAGPISLWEIRDSWPRSPGLASLTASRLLGHRWYVVPDREGGHG